MKNYVKNENQTYTITISKEEFEKMLQDTVTENRLCGSLVDEKTRFEAAFFESVRTMIVRLMSGGTGKKFTLPEVNERINELLKHSIKSEGVINLFSDVQSEFSLFAHRYRSCRLLRSRPDGPFPY